METKEIVFWIVAAILFITVLLWPTVELPKGKLIRRVKDEERNK